MEWTGYRHRPVSKRKLYWEEKHGNLNFMKMKKNKTNIDTNVNNIHMPYKRVTDGIYLPIFVSAVRKEATGVVWC